MYQESKLEKELSVQKLLFEGCRELNYSKVLQAINAGANVNLKAPFQLHNEKTAEQYSDDISIFETNGSFSPLSLIAMHGARKIGIALGSDKKACEIAELLLENGADIDAVDTGDMGNTPLHWSLVTFKKNLCKLFIQHAIAYQKNVINIPNKPAKDYFGSNPPLIMALKAGSQYLTYNTYDLELAELLIAAGADVNATDHFQQSAFHWAAILHCPEDFFNLLLEKQAQFQRNKFGKTPKDLYDADLKELMIDICKHSSSFTELGFHLIDWNQHPIKRDMDRNKALENRNSANQKQISELLGLFDASLNTEAINLLGDAIDEQDDWGRTQLHRAVFYGKVEEFDKLLNAGADITIKDHAGLTPLELAKSLQQKFTYKVSSNVSSKFFSGIDTSIKAANCAVWKKFEETLSQRNQAHTL